MAAASSLRRLAHRVRAAGVALEHPRLRRLEMAWLGFNLAEYAISVALGVYAYAAGGSIAVGIVTLSRTLPAIVSAPSFAVFTDRLPRRTMLAAGLGGRAVVALGIAAALTADVPVLVVYGLAALDVVAASAFYPAAAALIPDLTHDPAELASANAMFSLMENAGALAGPLLAAAVIYVGGVAPVFVVAAAICLVGAGMAWPLTTDRTTRSLRDTHVVGEIADGLRVLRSHRAAATVVGVWTLESWLVGASEVFVVVMALDLLGWGDPGVGVLGAVLGVGGLLGATAMAGGSRRGRYGAALALSLAVMGVAFAAAAMPVHAVAALAMGLVGYAQSQCDVAAQSLLQRAVPAHSLGRILGAFEGLYWASLGLGAIVASAVIEIWGLRTALVAFGAVAALIGLVARPALRRLDLESATAAAVVPTLAAHPIFGALPIPTLEYLAGHATPRDHGPDERIITEGQSDDGVFVIVSGTVVVSTEGRALATLEAGELFGEIAALNGGPRTADVTASSPTSTVELPADRFAAAVASHAASAHEAESIAIHRLSATRRIRSRH